MNPVRDPRLYLDDMLSAAADLQQLASEGEAAFMAEYRSRLAAERLIEIIGEAAAQMPAGFKERFADVPWRVLSDMRNRLIHGYHSVNSARVWQTLVNDIPVLVIQLQAVLAELEKSS